MTMDKARRKMKAMVIVEPKVMEEGEQPLLSVDMDIPEPADNEVLIKVRCCGVCHTELDEIEGRLMPSGLPRVPGHQVVGKVIKKGKAVEVLQLNDRVGVAWIFSSCGECEYCLSENDNLCAAYQATGKDANGGYAEYMVVPENCAFVLPDSIKDIDAAPLLCAGAIGYRSLRLAKLKNGQTLGMTGFGASAHLMMKMIRYIYPDSPVYVFARQKTEQQFALALGAKWAGNTDDHPPSLCHAIIDTTPAWFPIIKAMECLRPGGRLVINAIRKEHADMDTLAALNYEDHLWREKEIKSVANVSRKDVREFLDLAAQMNIQPEVKIFALRQANEALLELRFSPVKGAKVLVCDSDI